MTTTYRATKLNTRAGPFSRQPNGAVREEQATFYNTGLEEGQVTSLDYILPLQEKSFRDVLVELYARGGCRSISTREVSIAFKCTESLVEEFEGETGLKFLGLLPADVKSVPAFGKKRNKGTTNGYA